MSHIEESDDSAAAAIGYTNEFFDAAVAKVDAAFGKGFAKANPMLVGALVQASAANLNAFMVAATAMDPGMFGGMGDDPFPPPSPASGKKGRR